MTEAEELEMLELEEQEAAALASKSAPSVRVDDSDPMSEQERLANAPPSGEQRPMDATQAAAINGLDAVTLGFSDETFGLTGAVGEMGKQALQGVGLMDEEPRVSDAIARDPVRFNGKIAVPGQHIPDSGREEAPTFGESYRGNREVARYLQGKSVGDQFGASLGSGLVSSLAVPMATVGKAAQGAKFMSRAGQFAKAGIPVGAAAGLGESTADATKGDGYDAMLDMGVGMDASMMIGGVLGPAAERVSGSVAGWLKNRAAVNAFKAMNGNAKIKNKARDMGYRSDEDIMELGRFGLDNELIPWNGDPAVIVERANAMLDKIGPKIGAFADKADEAAKYGNSEGAYLAADYGRVKEAAKGAVKPMSPDDLTGLAADDLANTGPANAFIDRIDEQAELTPGSFQGMFKQKVAAQRGVNWSDKAPAAKSIHRDAVQRYTNDFQEQIGDVLGPDELSRLRGLNSEYGKGSDIVEFATDASTRGAQHKYKNPAATALMTVASGGAGMALESPAVAIGGMALTGAASFLNNAGRMARTQDATRKLLSHPKYGPIINEAMQKGGNAFAVQNYLLKQRDPEYRALTSDEFDD